MVHSVSSRLSSTVWLARGSNLAINFYLGGIGSTDMKSRYTPNVIMDCFQNGTSLTLFLFLFLSLIYL
jgi:hypothetical protein